MKKSFVEFNEISKAYKDVQALKGISFNINKGEIYGYIGPNGAGKTTTIKILVGLIRDYEGSIYINGKSMSYEKNFRDLGYLPQDVGFQEWRTVDHAMMTFGRLSGMAPSAIKEKIPGLLEMVTLEDVEIIRKKQIRKLSGGMKQKLLLAQALLHDPQFLVLDEPMTGLDPLSRYELKDIFRRLSRDEGKTIFFSTHILNDLEGICDNLAVLDHGEIKRISNPKALREEFRTEDIVSITYADDAPMLSGVESFSFVKEVEIPDEKHNGNTHLIHFNDGVKLDESIRKLMQSLVDQQSRVRNVSLVKPTLDEIYLKLIGRNRK